jgi:hypothetical protein
MIAALLSVQTIFSQKKTSVFLNAGLNSTSLHVPDKSEVTKLNSGISWQAGMQWEYISGSNIMLFGGIGAYSYNYTVTKMFELQLGEIVTKDKTKPGFLNIPAGVGYHWPVSDKMNINFYGGAYFNIGIIGQTTKERFETYPGRILYTKRKSVISYGNESDSDLRLFNWGIQPGISIGFMKRWQLAINYQIGMSTMYPEKNPIQNDNNVAKSRSLSMTLKYKVINWR